MCYIFLVTPTQSTACPRRQDQHAGCEHVLVWTTCGSRPETQNITVVVFRKSLERQSQSQRSTNHKAGGAPATQPQSQWNTSFKVGGAPATKSMDHKSTNRWKCRPQDRWSTTQQIGGDPVTISVQQEAEAQWTTSHKVGRAPANKPDSSYSPGYRCFNCGSDGRCCPAENADTKVKQQRQQKTKDPKTINGFRMELFENRVQPRHNQGFARFFCLATNCKTNSV